MSNEKLPVVEGIDLDAHATSDIYAELTNGKEDGEDE